MGDRTHLIVAFTKDWDDVPTCTTHILREMARTEPVLWVGSIGTRKPSAGSAKDLRRIWRRIWRGMRPPEHKEHHLYVLHPLLVPKASSAWAQRLNRMMMRWYVTRFERLVRRLDPSTVLRPRPRKRMTGKLATGGIDYWCFVPNAVDLLPAQAVSAARGDQIVYYVADDWTAFHNLDGTWMKVREDALVQRADQIFATSVFLVDKLQRLRPAGAAPVVHMSHGVDHALFAKALDDALPLPVELQMLPRPIIGFYGNLHPWVDFALIEKLAVARPAWSFVLIGEDYGAPATLTALDNVHLPGRRAHAQLVDYCRGFDVAIIPYDMTQARMESVNPVKTKELLSAGVPVVAAEVPALAGYGEDVLLCRTPQDWLAALERQLARSTTDRAAISARMRGETWQAKVARIRELSAARP